MIQQSRFSNIDSASNMTLVQRRRNVATGVETTSKNIRKRKSLYNSQFFNIDTSGLPPKCLNVFILNSKLFKKTYFYSHKSIGWYKVIPRKTSAKPVGALVTRLVIDMQFFR